MLHTNAVTIICILVREYFSEMVRAAVLITCLLLTILVQSFGESIANRSSTKKYAECYQKCVNKRDESCNGSNESVNKARRVYCAPDGQVRYCQNECDHLAEQGNKDPVESGDEEYLSADLKKRELDELRKLIGIGS